MGTKRGNIYIKNPKLPFDFNNREGAYFLSAIFFDGGIDNQLKPHYGNLDLSMRKNIVKCAKSIFGEINSKEVNFERGAFVRFPKTIGIILNHCFCLGFGNKIYCDNKIPEFVFELSKNAKSCFLRQAFDDDGSVSVNKKMIRIVGVKNVKKEHFHKNDTNFNLLAGIRSLLNDFKIRPNSLLIEKSFSNMGYRRAGEFYRHIFTFSITGKENLERFYNLIGFNIPYKMKRLDSLLKSYKSIQLRKGEIYNIALDECRKLERYITISSLAKSIKRSYRQTARIVKLLEEKGFISLKKPSVNIKGRRMPAIYSLIKKNGKFSFKL